MHSPCRSPRISWKRLLLTPWLLLAALGAQGGQGEIVVQWFGQSAFKITSARGKVIMIDPYLTQNPKTPQEFNDLTALGKVDLVLVTHAHGDHVGDGRALARMHQVPLYAPPGLNDTLVALGDLRTGMSCRAEIVGVMIRHLFAGLAGWYPFPRRLPADPAA